MVRLGNFLFHYRNMLFPVFYFMLFIPSPKVFKVLAIPVTVGFLVALTGQVIRIATIGLVYIIRGGKNRRIYAEGLVTEGIFSHCRNPLYAGNILIIAGLGIMSNSWLFIALIFPLFLLFYQAIVRAEEEFLHSKFGEAYEQYKKETNRWIPDLKGLRNTMSSMRFNWKRVILKEYNTTYIWMSGAVMLVVKDIYQLEGITTTLHTWSIFAIILLFLLSCYLFVRYMKKSKRWVAA
jgi:protein-S-isoprenylcysteine O-methyltransferase Ste14